MHKYVHYSFVFQKSNTSSKANWHLQNHITFCTLVSRVIWHCIKSCMVHLQILELRTWQNFTWATHKINLLIGRTSLSLALGNMVVARQILLIFNLSYLPCSVQFVNKNYCHAKNDLFTTCWCHYFVREWCNVSLEEVLMNTPSGQKPSVVLTSKVRWARSENGCVRKTVGNFYKKNVQTWSYTF